MLYKKYLGFSLINYISKLNKLKKKSATFLIWIAVIRNMHIKSFCFNDNDTSIREDRHFLFLYVSVFQLSENEFKIFKVSFDQPRLIIKATGEGTRAPVNWSTTREMRVMLRTLIIRKILIIK